MGKKKAAKKKVAQPGLDGGKATLKKYGPAHYAKMADARNKKHGFGKYAKKGKAAKKK